MKELRNLLIVNHVVHYSYGDRLFAYGPYAREIDIWADLFPQMVICAPMRQEPPPSDCLPFTRANISLFPIRETGGTSLQSKLTQVLLLPWLIVSLCRAMRAADAIHVRCPGNVGLLGILLAPLFSRRLIAKYAGQWTGYPGEARTWRLQRALLRSRWWQGPVTVYGEWPDQPAKVIPFFTSILTGGQVSRARAAARNKRSGGPLRVLFVGRLSASKNVGSLLDAVRILKDSGIQVSCAVLGEGPERGRLEAQCSHLGLGSQVQFTGAVPFEHVLEYYEWADALALTSETEGWPKAISEAMAFGVICVGSNRGFVPRMLGEGRGLLVSPRDVPALSAALAEIATRREKFAPMREKAAEWAQRHSLDSLRGALHDLLSTQWGVTLRETAQPAGARPAEVRA